MFLLGESVRVAALASLNAPQTDRVQMMDVIFGDYAIRKKCKTMPAPYCIKRRPVRADIAFWVPRFEKNSSKA